MTRARGGDADLRPIALSTCYYVLPAVDEY